MFSGVSENLRQRIRTTRGRADGHQRNSRHEGAGGRWAETLGSGFRAGLAGQFPDHGDFGDKAAAPRTSPAVPSVGVSTASKPQAHRFINLSHVATDGGGNDENRARGFRHDPSRRLDAINAGHDQVHEHEIDRITTRGGDRLGPLLASQATSCWRCPRRPLVGGPRASGRSLTMPILIPASPIRSTTVARNV